MNAFICDRCGKADAFRKVTYIQAFDSAGEVKKLCRGDKEERLTGIHLCPHCFTRFKEFLGEESWDLTDQEPTN